MLISVITSCFKMQLIAIVGIVNISYGKHFVKLTSEHRFVTVNLVT